MGRLQSCQASINGKQQEFNVHGRKCLEPELTKKTWHGHLANEFNVNRERLIHRPYMEIATIQFSAVSTRIAEKLSSLQTEISSIHRTIESIHAARAAEAARTAKVSRS